MPMAENSASAPASFPFFMLPSELLVRAAGPSFRCTAYRGDSTHERLA
jgi:hypothetical protein